MDQYLSRYGSHANTSCILDVEPMWSNHMGPIENYGLYLHNLIGRYTLCINVAEGLFKDNSIPAEKLTVYMIISGQYTY